MSAQEPDCPVCGKKYQSRELIKFRKPVESSDFAYIHMIGTREYSRCERKWCDFCNQYNCDELQK